MDSSGESEVSRPMKTRGQALLLVMWAMFVMCFSILGLMRLLNITIGTATAMERVAIASSTAFAGVTLGRNPDFPANGNTEVQKFPDGSQLEVVVTSENGKLNINKMLENNDRDTLHALFRIWGLNDVQASTVVDCLQDYVEPGQDRRLNGAKKPQYLAARRPPPSGKPFISVEEMNQVLHFDLVTEKNPNWREYFTIYGDGTLDLVSAPPELIKVVCRIGDSGVRSLLQKRSKDNVVMEDSESARMAMGLTEKEFSELSDRVSIGGNVYRVRATGAFEQAKRTIEAIFQVESGHTNFLEWKEW